MPSTEEPIFSLYARRQLRLDVIPFTVMYALGFTFYFCGSPRASAAANVATPLCAALHIFTFLSCHWWLSMRCALQLRRVYRVTDASLVRAHPPKGRSELCALEVRPAATVRSNLRNKRAVPSTLSSDNEIRFEYRKRVYIFAPRTGAGNQVIEDDAVRFSELTMPTKLPLAQYLASGHGLKGDALAQTERKFGKNSFAIPARTFGSLFVEHALAPFFVFQVRFAMDGTS